MKIQEVSFTLKDGRKALLRGPLPEDAQGTLDYLRKTAEETDFLMRTPEECGRYTLEDEIALFEMKNASKNDAFIMCIVDGRVAGNCELRFNNRVKTRYRAQIGIAIIKEFWGLGIGTKMFEEMIRMAEEREGVTQLELEFIEGNVRGRALYEKMGFTIAGVHPNAVCMKDGRLCNEYLMIREIKR